MKNILLTCLIIFTGTLFAQDKVLLKSGELLNVKVIEINPHEVKYQVSSGTTIVISLKNVESITYANGQSENLVLVKAEIADLSKNHLVEINLADLMFSNVSAQYEYYPSSDRSFSFILPLRVGLPTNESHYSDRNVLETGIGFLLYPYRGSRMNFFTGIECAYRLNEYKSQIGTIQDHYGALYLTNGMRINVSPKFGLSYGFSAGFRRELDDHNTDAAGKLHVSLFYRF